MEYLKGLALALLTNMRQGLEMLDKDKHSSLLQIVVNEKYKKFYKIGPGVNVNELHLHM